VEEEKPKGQFLSLFSFLFSLFSLFSVWFKHIIFRQKMLSA
jgi:hypothetical protein